MAFPSALKYNSLLHACPYLVNDRTSYITSRPFASQPGPCKRRNILWNRYEESSPERALLLFPTFLLMTTTAAYLIGPLIFFLNFIKFKKLKCVLFANTKCN